MRKIIVDNNNENQRIDKFLLKFLKDMPKSFLYKMFRKKNIKLNSKKIEGTEIIKRGDEIDIFMNDEALVNFGANKETLDLFDFRKNVPENEKKTALEKMIEKEEQEKRIAENFKNEGESQKNIENNQFSSEVNKKEKMRKPNLDVVYEDEDILIVNKPVNMLVHPDESDGSEGTLLSEIMCYLDYKKDRTYLSSKAMNFRPAICNRLDRNTTGLVIACKSFAKTRRINEMIARHEVEKKYLAVVCGKVAKDSEELINYYEKDGETNEATIFDIETEHSKEVKLRYNVVKRGMQTTLLEVELITGKSHQIRAQLAHIGHPIVGDMKYGDEEINEKFERQMKVKSQLLCAYKVTIGKETYMIDCDYEKYVR